MNQTDIKEAIKINTLAVIGPLSVTFSILLLIINHSPFYIDLSVTALAGIALASRFKMKGLLASVALTIGVVGYDALFDGQAVHLWDIGIIASMLLAYVATSLISQEFFDVLDGIHKASYKAIADLKATQSIIDQTAEVQALTEEIAKTKAHLLENSEKLTHAYDSVKSQSATAEMLDRLLKMAREELSEQVQLREKTEQDFFEERRKKHLLEEKLQDYQTKLESHHQAVENLKKLELEKNALEQKSRDTLNELQEKLEESKREILELSGKAASKEILEREIEVARTEIHTLTDQLGKLTDRLKELQDEKDKLEKALDEALNPAQVEEEEEAVASTAEMRKVHGKYNQLKEQFKEKTALLEDARRKLFYAEETLLKYKHDEKEEKLFDQSGTYAALADHFLEFESIYRKQEEEIALLEELLHRKK